jgi:hypothetical protein
MASLKASPTSEYFQFEHDSAGSLCEYKFFHVLFCYLKGSLVGLRNIVISTGLWLRNTLISIHLGMTDHLGGYNIRVL